MLRSDIPPTKDKKTYFALWDEVFFNSGGNILGNHLDQNRAFAGIGRKLTDHVKIEVGCMEQSVHRRGGENWENNHTVCFWLMSNLPFFPVQSR